MSTTSTFVPADLDASQWANIEPLYRALVERPLSCEDCLEQLILDRSDLDAAVSEAGANLYIRMTRYTDDADANAGYEAFVKNVEPKLKEVSFELDKRIATSEFAGALDQERYCVLLKHLQRDVELFRAENVPIETELAMLDQKYSQICGAMTVEFDGQERTMAQMNRYLEETDRSTREEAWRATSSRRMQDAEQIDDIFDEMIAKRAQIAANTGYPNFRDLEHDRKHRFDYTPADCETFHDAVEAVCVPLIKRLHEERMGALGVDMLRPWDLSVDPKGHGPLRPFETADELVGQSSRMFHRMDPELAGMFDSMREGDCLDLESRKGKAPGGYQYQRDRSRTPFIFMNAAGLERDLTTMVHEAGHAFHSMLCNDEPLLAYRHSPIEFAEVASMSMELLTYPYLDEFYEGDDRARAIRKHLEAIPKALAWIATIDAFQHWIYTNPGHTRQDRHAKWIEIDSRFGGLVSWDGLEQEHRVLWQRQLHLFGIPFYYIEYGIAQLGALQVWLQSKQSERDALDAYKRALALGGSKPLPTLFETAGGRFDFGRETVGELMAAVEKELETV